MKRAVVIGLIILVASFVWKDVVVYGVFKIQQDYISQNQCVNRDRPITQCHGSCVLKERLAKPVNEGLNSDPESVFPEVKIELYVDELDENTTHTFKEIKPSEFISFKELKGFLPAQIKPPEFV